MLEASEAQLPAIVIGREREAVRFEQALATSLRDKTAATIRIVAPSGYGKTALLHAALRRATEDGWLVFEARCYAGQRRTPGAALRRLVADRIQTLGDSNQPYLGGLEALLTSSQTDAARFELAFSRLIEGLLIDRPCAIAFDDAQWLDRQTLSTLHRLVESNQERQLVLVASHQVGHEVALPPASVHVPIALEALKADCAGELIGSLWPDVTAEIASSIAERSRCVPFDVIALTQQARAERAESPADVSRTAYTVLRETVAALPDEQREFLQICSLIREPIELDVLRRVVGSESDLESLIARSSGRYVEMDGATLRFNHFLIAEAIRSTVSSPLGLRRRIIAAYLAAKSPRAGDYDRIAALAAEIGDSETEFRALVSLASAAYAQDAYESVIVAYEKALQIRRPDDAEYLTCYNQYSIALRLAGRWSDARKVQEESVFNAIARDVRGAGLLASTLLWNIRMETDRDAAWSQYREFHETIAHPADRQDLLSMGALLAAEADDLAAFTNIRDEIQSMREEPSRYALTAFQIAQATMSSRRGDFDRAWASLATARNHIDRQRSLHKYSVDTFGNSIRIKEHGCANFAIRFSWLQERGDGSVSNQEPPQAVMLQALELAAVVDFAAGRWAEANAKLDPATIRALGPSKARTVLLAIAAAMAAFNGQTPELADAIEADLRYMQERALWRRSLPLAFWWAAHICRTRPADAARLVEPLRPHLRAVPDSTAFHFPIASVLYAVRSEQKQLLRHVLDARHREHTPWDRANDALAAGIGLRALREASARQQLANAHAGFTALEARFLAAYAAQELGKPTPQERELLKSLGVSDHANGEVQPRASLREARSRQPTLREREVADLVAEGFTNRTIAERLTLSERTVEVHIAKLFDKLGVENRTQLSNYVLKLRSGNGAAPPSKPE